MDENKINNKTPWWEPAMEIFGEVSTWVVVPIILALVVGKYLDGYFDTKPWIFLGLTFIAFGLSSYGIVQVVGRYMKRINKEEEDKKKKNGN